MRGGLCSGVRRVRQLLMGARVGPSSPALLLVAGLCRWVTGWSCHLAAAVAHRAWTRVTCLVRQWIHGLRQSWSLCRIFLLFYAKENSDPEVVGLLSGVSESR